MMIGRRLRVCFAGVGKPLKCAVCGTRWQESMANCKSGGASHRKKGGHVTPKLGTAELRDRAQSLRKLTSAASTHLVARGMSVVSNDDVCSGENGSERRSSKRV